MKPSKHRGLRQCALCLETKELRFSHIIPNLFFRKLKRDDQGGQAIYLNMEGEGRVKQDQDTWQEYLLCRDCEAIFEKYETYVSQLLYYPTISDLPTVNTQKTRILRGIQPETFKLFQLSILWRAGISSLPIFRRIQLSVDEQDFLRKVLYGKSPYLYEQYWCEIFTYYDSEKLLKESAHLIIQPTIYIQHGNVYYVFVFGGYVWVYNMSHSMPNPMKVTQFQDKGEYHIPKYDLFEIPVIGDALKQAAKMGLFSRSNVKQK